MISALLILIVALAMPVHDGPELFEEDLDLRTAGVTATSPEIDDEEEEIVIPGFIRRRAIDLNGSVAPVWNPEDRCRRTIVHIGDSHLQADIATSLVRDLMQYDYGAAGRGLIEPLRLSGTNEPRNYIFRSNIPWTPEKFMKPSGNISLGFTGCALTAMSPAGTIEVGTDDRTDWNPFSSVILYIDGTVEVTGVTDGNGIPMTFDADHDQHAGIIELHLPRAVTTARIAINGYGQAVLRGALLSADRPGLYYHVIGHNGATYRNYTDIDDFSAGIIALDPDLIIISLGTNEAFGKNFDSSEFISRMDALVSELSRSVPEAMLLLVTPQECDRRMRASGNKKSGKRRSQSKIVFSVNPNVAKARQAILDYGKNKGIAVYDFFEVAGGAGSAANWVNAGLMSKDHVHLSVDGYRLQGQLLYDALSELLNPDFDNGSID